MSKKPMHPNDIVMNNVMPIRKNVDVYELEIVNASDIEAKQQPWLWPGVIPLDTCSLFVGEGGIGKSLLLLDICAKISVGRQLKVGGETVDLPKGKVIILTAEDDFEYQVKPKLIAAEADCSNIEILRTMINPSNGKRKFIDLDKNLFLLEERLSKHKDVKIVIIDPISYFTGELKDHINVHVSNFLSGLNDLAKKYNVAIILNKHFRKQSSGSIVTHAMSEVAGGGSWVNTPRSAWIIGRHPEDKEKICMIDLKSNLRKKIDEAYAYKIVPKVIQTESGSMQSLYIEWFSEMVSISANEVMSKDTFDKNKAQIAYDLIIKHLSDNGQSVLKHIEEMVLRNGIKQRTFEEAKSMIKKRGLVKTENGTGGNKLWTLL